MKLQTILTQYESASGAHTNKEKSKALALGAWDTTHDILGIPYNAELTILGVTIKDTIRQSSSESWKRMTENIRAKAILECARMLSLHTRVSYIHEQLYSRAWYIAQVFPPLTVYV
jgi:hypothetical protein